MKYSVLFFVFLISCAPDKQIKKNESSEVLADGTKVVRSRYSNGITKAEVPYREGKKNGLSKSFDKNGKISLELPYLNDKREGQSRRFYEGGKQLYQTTEYKEDKMHGRQVKFRENGDRISEARYENDYPCLDLIEYYKDNTKRKDYPKIVVTPIDQLESRGTYHLEISMSEKVRKVKYYLGRLTKSACLSDDLYQILQDETRRVGRLTYNLPPGGFMMDELNIIAAVETVYGNTYITERAYNLAIEY